MTAVRIDLSPETILELDHAMRLHGLQSLTLTRGRAAHPPPSESLLGVGRRLVALLP